jgi:hypothetical protein
MLLTLLLATAHAEPPAASAEHRATAEASDEDGKKGKKGKKGDKKNPGGKGGGKKGDGQKGGGAKGGGQKGDGQKGGGTKGGGTKGGGQKGGGQKGGGKGGGRNGGGGSGDDGSLRGSPGGGRDGGPRRDPPSGEGPRRDPPCGDGTLRGGGDCSAPPAEGPRGPAGGGPRETPGGRPGGGQAHAKAPTYDWAGKVGIGAAPGFALSGQFGEPTLDPGLRLIGRFRPSNVVGLELNASHHDSFGAFGDARRANTAFDGLVVLNALPRTGAVLAFELGGQYALQRYADTVDEPLVTDKRWGADLGMVFGAALSEGFTLEFSNRMVAWLFDRHEPGEQLAAYQFGMNLVGWF